MLNSANQVNQIFGLLYVYSYLILFPLVVVEGPVVTIIAGFLVSLGFMDFWPTYLTVIIGDLAGDLLYYAAGRYWLGKTYKAVLKFLNVDIKMVHRLEKAIKKRPGPFLFFGKLSHAIGGVILFAAGSAGISLKEFITSNFYATLIKSLVLLAVGYYFGNTVTNFNKAVDLTVLGLFVFTLILIGIYFAVTYVANKFVKKLEG
jgi:membrane protein DedA with SNARE-associated domain